MSEDNEKEEEKPVVAKTAIDLQRLKLQKLMKNPEKLVVLPERPKAKSTPTVPEFVRNVMGSSAGAGSGEFHVYRHLRRKEYARQKFIQEKGHKELLDAEYHRKIEENKRIAEEITAKKRAKRLRKKQKWKQKKRIKAIDFEEHDKSENSDFEEKSSDEQETNDKDNCELENKSNNKVKTMLSLNNLDENNTNQSKTHSKIDCTVENSCEIGSEITNQPKKLNCNVDISKNADNNAENAVHLV